MFVQIFTGVDIYVLININHIVSIDAFAKGSIITLSTGETVESTDSQSEIMEQIAFLG